VFAPGGRIFWVFPCGYNELVLGPFVYRNQYAAFMEMLLPIAIWQSLHARHRAFRYFIMAGAMMRAAAKLVLLGALSTAVAGWQVLWERLARPDQGRGRREFFIASQAMLHDNPWPGVGLENWPTVYPQYATFDDGTYVNQAHDDWIQWAVEGGLPFALLLVSLVVMATPKAVNSLWGIGLLAVCVHASVDYPSSSAPAWQPGSLSCSEPWRARRCQLSVEKKRIRHNRRAPHADWVVTQGPVAMARTQDRAANSGTLTPRSLFIETVASACGKSSLGCGSDGR